MSSFNPCQLPLKPETLGPTYSEMDYARQYLACRYAWYLIDAINWRHPEMAKSNGTRPTFEPVEFVQLNLNGDDEKGFRKWESDNADSIVSKLDEFMADGHKVGITFDVNNACFITSATCKNDRSPNHNRCMTARSDSWYEALELLLYKHLVKAKGGDWSEVSRPAAWG